VLIVHSTGLLEQIEERLVVDAVKLSKGHGRGNWRGILGANRRDAREKIDKPYRRIRLCHDVAP
jgi:hypothetical protein